MATIKSYTDLEQSRKLADILPLESADMCWQYQKDRWVGEPDYKEFPQFEHATDKRDIPCWSLASLLGVLPKRIELELVAYELSIYLNGLYYWNVNNGNLLLEVKCKDNLVDSCVAMIEKLNELNLL